MTAAVNAAVRPILHRYIDRLQSELSDKGSARDLLVMNGNGGMVSARLVDKESAKTVMSGPASGVMAAANAAKRAGIDNLITYDMGGTSTDVALVKDAIPAVSNELDVEYAMPIHVPMVDVRTIGSGGGSIASITDAGLLRVGPESAGATPGPICYGRGGENPTITDANLVLGRLNAEKLLSTSETPSIDKIRAILQEKIADPLGSMSTRQPAQSFVSPMTEWLAQLGLSRYRKDMIRAISHFSPLAVPGRCTPHRLVAS